MKASDTRPAHVEVAVSRGLLGAYIIVGYK